MCFVCLFIVVFCWGGGGGGGESAEPCRGKWCKKVEKTILDEGEVCNVSATLKYPARPVRLPL